MPEYLSILIIEGDLSNAAFLKECLDSLETIFKMVHADSLREALSQLEIKKFDLIISNLYLEESHGLETLQALQELTNAPIIIIGDFEEDLAQQAISAGAQDFIPKKEWNTPLLLRTIHFAIEREKLRKELRALSYKDELTSLYNRRGFFAFFEQQYVLAKRTKKGFYLFLIDLDYLKNINDSFGHLTGDTALKETAQCLRTCFRAYDILGRIGGDEFAIIALNISRENGLQMKQAIHKEIDRFNLANAKGFKLSISIGMAYYDGNPRVSLEDLILQADQDLYAEKKISHLRTH